MSLAALGGRTQPLSTRHCCQSQDNSFTFPRGASISLWSLNFPSSVSQVKTVKEVWIHHHPHPHCGPFSPRNFDAHTLTLRLPEALPGLALVWLQCVAGQLLALEPDNLITRKITEKGQESQAGSVLAKEMSFPRPEAADRAWPLEIPTHPSFTRTKNEPQEATTQRA